MAKITDEEFEKMWAKLKKRDARQEEEFNALPEAEKKRLEKEFSEYNCDRFLENPLGDDEND